MGTSNVFNVAKSCAPECVTEATPFPQLPSSLAVAHGRQEEVAQGIGECMSQHPEPFNSASFRRELSLVMADLRVSSNVAAAVQRIRAQNVPVSHQAQEYADIVTRASECS